MLSIAVEDSIIELAFSKSLITRLLMKAGFRTIQIVDHPNPKARDMIVEVRKS